MSPSIDRFRRQLLTAVALAGSLVAVGPAVAQGAWPSQPVKILVGFPGGSTPDVAARVLAEALGKAWGQTVVVENRPGASGNIAADAVAKARDDHTLGVVINGNLTSARQLNPRLPYDPARDFSFISLLATAPLVLATNADKPSGAAFFGAMRSAGKSWNFGSVGIGSVGHLGMELLKSKAGAPDALHVPYNGNPAVITALIQGQVQMALMPPGIALPQAKDGKIKVVGVTGPRTALAPDVEPLSAQGVALDDLEVWTAVVGPASMSKAAQDRLARDVPELLRSAEVRARLLAAGWQAQGTSSDGLRQRVEAEAKVLGAIISAQGIKLE